MCKRSYQSIDCFDSTSCAQEIHWQTEEFGQRVVEALRYYAAELNADQRDVQLLNTEIETCFGSQAGLKQLFNENYMSSKPFSRSFAVKLRKAASSDSGDAKSSNNASPRLI